MQQCNCDCKGRPIFGTNPVFGKADGNDKVRARTGQGQGGLGRGGQENFDTKMAKPDVVVDVQW